MFPVLGHPVAQVRAPAVFNALFAQAGIDALCFGLDLSPAEALATCRTLLQSPSVGGVLVTVPYKKALAALADTLGTAATRAGAVNALRLGGDGRIEGDLFDGLGFVRGLAAAGHTLAHRRVLLLGAGGAGSAIATSLADAGVAALGLYDPAAASVEALARQLRAQAPGLEVLHMPQAQAQGFDVIVNASPLGLRPGDPLPLDPAEMAHDTLVCDIVMEPETTAFLHAALARGLPIHRGRAMLDQQLPAYLGFFGMDALARRVRISSNTISLQETA